MKLDTTVEEVASPDFAPAPSDPRAGDAEAFRSVLLLVTLNDLRRSETGRIRVTASFPQSAPLAQQVPALV